MRQSYECRAQQEMVLIKHSDIFYIMPSGSPAIVNRRTADTQTCVPRRAHNGYGVCCFATAGPSLWNNLPLHLREPAFHLTVLELC